MRFDDGVESVSPRTTPATVDPTTNTEARRANTSCLGGAIMATAQNRPMYLRRRASLPVWDGRSPLRPECGGSPILTIQEPANASISIAKAANAKWTVRDRCGGGP